MEKKEMTVEERLARLEEHMLRPKNMLTFEEACEYTQLSRSLLYKLTSQKKIPHYKPTGRVLYFERTELDLWLRQNPIRTEEQISDEAEQYILNHPYIP